MFCVNFNTSFSSFPKKGHTLFNCIVLYLCACWMISNNELSMNRNYSHQIKYESKWAWSGQHLQSHVWKLLWKYPTIYCSHSLSLWVYTVWFNVEIHLFLSVAIKIMWFVSFFPRFDSLHCKITILSFLVTTLRAVIGYDIWTVIQRKFII